MQFNVPSVYVSEGDGEALLSIVRGDDGNMPVTVELDFIDIAATNGVDYIGNHTTIAFASNERMKFVPVPIIRNANLEPINKTFQATLSNAKDASLGIWIKCIVTIRDNDRGFQFASASYTVSEDAGSLIIPVFRGTDATNSITSVRYATSDGTARAGSAYIDASGTLFFAPGEMVKQIRIPILNDAIKEDRLNFQVTLSEPADGSILGSPNIATVSVLDNDPGAGFESTNYSVWQGMGNIVLTILRGNDSDMNPFTLDYATGDLSAKAGIDYQPMSGTLEFKHGEMLQSLTIPILRHAGSETSLNFSVNLSKATGGMTLGATSSVVTISRNYCQILPPFDSQPAIQQDGSLIILT